MFTVSQVSKQIGVSPQAVYKKINKTFVNELKDYISNESGKTLIYDEGLKILKDSFKSTNVNQQLKNGSTMDNNTYQELVKQLEVKDKQIERLETLLENAQLLHLNEQKKALMIEHDKTGSRFKRWFNKSE